ncbi:MAG: nucleotidyltransferase domain-containing protein, partial [Anaerolineae bacterium]|nr:nucleotidyltransferase domain-containing protein [Anaerolineae bacterium]
MQTITAPVKLPASHRADIEQAVEILKAGKCDQIFLFGSLVSEHFDSDSDIDLAIQGCPPGEFFNLLGQLLLALDHRVDLVNLDSPDAFAQFLKQEGELIRIG